MNSSTLILGTENLTKQFGSLVAVHDLNLEVMKGDVFGFLGPNGSGKTTTIRMILSLIRPTYGNIHLFGLDITTHRAEVLSRLGAIIEWPVFYPYLSGRDNLRVFAAAAGMVIGKASEKRIDEILDLTDLSGSAKRLYRTYSLGMKQRLGLGSALLADPELLLLDEPTNGLDPEGVHEIRQLILHLAEQGKTIFLSSHLLYEIQQVCNRVAIIRKGVLLKQGAVRKLLRQDSQLVLRLDNTEEMQRTCTILQQAGFQSEITRLWLEHMGQDVLCIKIDTSVQQSSHIVALLAHQELFVSLLQPYQASLETFYLELTDGARNNELQPEIPVHARK